MGGFFRYFAEQSNRFFLWWPIFFGTGIYFFFSLPRDPTVFELAILVLFLVVFTMLSAILGRVGQRIIWLTLLIVLGFLVMQLRTWSVAAPVLGWNYYGPVVGKVVALDRSNSNRIRVTLGDVALKKVGPEKTPKYVRISLHSNSGIQEPKAGERIAVTARLSPPSKPAEPGGFDFQRHAWFRSLGAVGYSRTPAVLISKSEGFNFWEWVFLARMNISEVLKSEMPGQNGAFAAAIIVGDRSGIDQEKLRHLRDSNLAHLLAISGLHMGLLSGFVFLLVRTMLVLSMKSALRLPIKEIAAGVAIFVATGYLLFSGMAIATQRAYVMVLVMLFAVLLKRRAISLRSVALAALIILVIRPESLIDIGFQMSFAATTALVVVFQTLRNNQIWMNLTQGRKNFLRGPITLTVSSLAAGFSTAPFAALYFNQFVSMGLLANLASVPVMGLIVVPAAVVAGILYTVGLQEPAFWIMGEGINWILWVAQNISELEIAVTPIAKASFWGPKLVICGALFFALWVGKLRLIGAFASFLGILFWSSSERPTMLISGNGRLVGILDQEKRALNRDRGNGFVAQVWLKNDGERIGQKEASKRYQNNPNKFVYLIDNHRIGYLWDRKVSLSEISDFCREVDFGFFPTWKDVLPDHCRGVIAKQFRETGSIAIYTKKEEVWIESAGEMTGARIWNTKKGAKNAPQFQLNQLLVGSYKSN